MADKSNQDYLTLAVAILAFSLSIAGLVLPTTEEFYLPYENLTGIAYGVEDCVNGTWIEHDLGSVPSNIFLTVNSNSYINDSCSIVAPSVIAKNSTHFQVGFYMRIQPISRLRGLTPEVAGWDTDPTDLEYATDGDWTTATGTGSTTLVGGIVGNLTWDMGAEYAVELRAKKGLWSGTGTVGTKWYWSNDNVTYSPVTGVSSSQVESTTELVIFAQTEFVYARYVRLITERVSDGNTLCSIKFYEVAAWDSSSAVTPIETYDNTSIFWTAIA